jgi:hypothetical protein
MDLSINWGSLIAGLILGGIAFIFGKLWKLSDDINAAHFKIRELEKRHGKPD